MYTVQHLFKIFFLGLVMFLCPCILPSIACFSRNLLLFHCCNATDISRINIMDQFKSCLYIYSPYRVSFCHSFSPASTILVHWQPFSPHLVAKGDNITVGQIYTPTDQQRSSNKKVKRNSQRNKGQIQYLAPERISSLNVYDDRQA